VHGDVVATAKQYSTLTIIVCYLSI